MLACCVFGGNLTTKQKSTISVRRLHVPSSRVRDEERWALLVAQIEAAVSALITACLPCRVTADSHRYLLSRSAFLLVVFSLPLILLHASFCRHFL